MEKEFIPYEQSLALKELGFDEPCFGYYVDGELRGVNLGMEELGGKEPYYQRFRFHTLSNHNIDNLNKIVVTAPTFSQAFRWFREKHNLMFQIFYLRNGNHAAIIHKTTPEYMDLVDQVTPSSGCFDEIVDCYSYEEAELECLKKLIEIIK